MFFIHEDKHSNYAESLYYLTTDGCHFMLAHLLH